MGNTTLDDEKSLSKGDIDILDFLNSHTYDSFEAPPLAIARNSGLSESYVKTRIRELAARNVVKQPTEAPRGYYRITDRGQTLLKTQD